MNYALSPRGRAIGAVVVPERKLARARGPQDVWQYRLLMSLAVVCFFLYAGIGRVLRRCIHPLSGRTGESLCAEARRLAATVMPYVFMS